MWDNTLAVFGHITVAPMRVGRPSVLRKKIPGTTGLFDFIWFPFLREGYTKEAGVDADATFDADIDISCVLFTFEGYTCKALISTDATYCAVVAGCMDRVVAILGLLVSLFSHRRVAREWYLWFSSRVVSRCF